MNPIFQIFLKPRTVAVMERLKTEEIPEGDPIPT
jgi:hypothetical protein